MKTRNRTTKLMAVALAVSLVAAICAAWGARPVQAIIIIGTKTGLFGVTAAQKVRISFVNLAQTRGGINPCVKVFDINGNMIAEFEGAPMPMGQGSFFDFDPVRLGLRPGERAQIRVEVELEIPPPDDSRSRDRIRPEDAAVTIEVFEGDTGKTTFTMGATLKGFNPQPEPPAPEGQRD